MSQNDGNSQENEIHQSLPPEKDEAPLPKSGEVEKVFDIVKQSEDMSEESSLCASSVYPNVELPTEYTAANLNDQQSLITDYLKIKDRNTSKVISPSSPPEEIVCVETNSLASKNEHFKIQYSMKIGLEKELHHEPIQSTLNESPQITEQEPSPITLQEPPSTNLQEPALIALQEPSSIMQGTTPFALEEAPLITLQEPFPASQQSPPVNHESTSLDEVRNHSSHMNSMQQNGQSETNKGPHSDSEEPFLNSVQLPSDDSLIFKNNVGCQKTRTSLGGLKPIYRLSMRLPQSIFNNIEIPNADKHRHIDKSGYLQKLCGRSFPYLYQWRRRYCVLARGKLFFYEKEDSKGSDKSSGVIDLKYFDHIVEASPKDAKKATNVFIITSQDRSFFDPGRFLLSADTLTEMNDWIQRLRESLELIKNNNRPLRKEERREAAMKELPKASAVPSGETHPKKKDSGHSAEDTPDGKKPKSEKAVLFDQKRIELHSRLAASQASSCSRTEKPDKATKKEESKRVKLNEENRSSPHKSEEHQQCSALTKLKPLESITKHRPKGPAGRRAPNSRRTVLMKQRASSMSALQQGNRTDDFIRSGTPQPNRLSSITTDGLSLYERNSAVSIDDSSEALSSDQFGFEDIDSELFFKRPELILEEDESNLGNNPDSSESKSKRPSKKSKLSSKISQTFSKSRNSHGGDSPVLVNRRDTFFSRFRSWRSPVSSHPDDKRPRRCTIL